MIDYFSLGHPCSRLRSHYALEARHRMFRLFMDVIRPGENDAVLDLGVTPDESLPESNYFEELYPYKGRLTAASIEDASFLERKYPGLHFRQISTGRLPFSDREFDIVFSSAVIEHVGDRVAQRAFVAEILRVGKRFFITTPNRQFPIEFHTLLPFLHWLPQPVHQAVLRSIGMEFWSRTENLNLLTPASFVSLFPERCSVNLHRHYLFGIPSNLVIYGKNGNP